MSRVDSPAARTALVVDDDPAIQRLLTTLLGRNGFAVDSAPGGREAFEYLRRRSYSVVLLDLMMPDVNGFELLERLERDTPWLVSRVIVVTGATARVVQGLGGHRVWGVIRKPFDMEHLLRSVRSCAAGMHLAAGAAGEARAVR